MYFVPKMIITILAIYCLLYGAKYDEEECDISKMSKILTNQIIKMLHFDMVLSSSH